MGGKKGGGDTKVKPTAAQIAQEEVAWKGWQDYQKILRPAEDNFMEKVDDLNSEQQYDNIAGTTNLGYQKQFGEARKELAGNLAQSGVDPSSGRFNAVMNANQSDQVQHINPLRNTAVHILMIKPCWRCLLIRLLSLSGIAVNSRKFRKISAISRRSSRDFLRINFRKEPAR